MSNVKRLVVVLATAMAAIVSYLIMISAVESLRTRAGVASDTSTPIDVIAWLGCIFTATAVGGSLACVLRRSAGVIGAFAVLLALGVQIALHVHSVIYDGLLVVFGDLTLPVIAWTFVSGAVFGIALDMNEAQNQGVKTALMVFVGALITLLIVFYPTERYFMSIWGNG